MDPGFLELKTVQQLFAKLEEDFTMANNEPMNSKAWFNFFVTAEHLPEWHLKNQKLANEFRKREPILRVCSHVANGGKHFEVDRHKAIAYTNVTSVITPPGWETRIEEARPRAEKAFSLHLSAEEAKELGDEILVADLAKRILAFYRKELAIT